jgi:hypothetical protein
LKTEFLSKTASKLGHLVDVCCQLFVISFRGKILRCGSTICWRAQAAPEISKKSGNSPLVIKDKWRPANNDYAQPAIKRDLLN